MGKKLTENECLSDRLYFLYHYHILNFHYHPKLVFRFLSKFCRKPEKSHYEREGTQAISKLQIMEPQLERLENELTKAQAEVQSSSKSNVDRV